MAQPVEVDRAREIWFDDLLLTPLFHCLGFLRPDRFQVELGANECVLEVPIKVPL